MGEVYEAEQLDTGRTVALKLLSAEFAMDADRQRRFEREARATQLASHPNVVRIEDVGTDDGRPFIAYERLWGGDVEELLQSHGVLSSAQAASIVLPILDALGAAHARGIVHRDLKAANIVLSSETGGATPKLIDFGVAASVQRAVGEHRWSTLTMSGAVVGSAHAMAPEQIRSEPVDGRCDLWAVGCLLYRLLSGHHAFEAPTHTVMMLRALRETPRPVSEWGNPVDAGVDEVIARCLAKSLDERFATADELAAALRGLGWEARPLELSIDHTRAEVTSPPTRTAVVYAPPPQETL